MLSRFSKVVGGVLLSIRSSGNERPREIEGDAELRSQGKGFRGRFFGFCSYLENGGVTGEQRYPRVPQDDMEIKQNPGIPTARAALPGGRV
jgi:hypothetical protein